MGTFCWKMDSSQKDELLPMIYAYLKENNNPLAKDFKKKLGAPSVPDGCPKLQDLLKEWKGKGGKRKAGDSAGSPATKKSKTEANLKRGHASSSDSDSSDSSDDEEEK